MQTEHERECWANYDDACLCDELRTAYQRGRWDATQAVARLSSLEKYENGYYRFSPCDECEGAAVGYDEAVEDAIAAARGNGEQA